MFKLSLGGIRSPEHCLKLERWQGLPHITGLTMFSFKVSFFFLFGLYSNESEDSLFIQFVLGIKYLNVFPKTT